MSCPHFLRHLFVLAIALLHLPGVAAADSGQHNLKKKKDTPTEFTLKPNGKFIGIDSTAPSGLTGTNAEKAEVDGNHWSVKLWHEVGTFAPATFQGAENTTLHMEGVHKIGPHPDDKANDAFGPFVSNKKILKLPFVPFGKPVSWKIKNSPDPHPTSDPNKPHRDIVAAAGKVSAKKGGENGPSGTPVGSNFVESIISGVRLQHQDKAVKPGSKISIGGGIIESSESYISFDPEVGDEMGELSIVSEIIDGVTGPAGDYEGDPLLEGSMVATFQYMGQEGDNYLFGDGTLSIYDPAGEFSFDATLPAFTMKSTYEERQLENFAAIDSLTIFDSGDEQIASSFLDDFFSVNYFGEGMTDAEQDILLDVGLTILSSFDLVDDSAGFTQATDIPARVQIGAFLELIPGDFNIDGEVDGDDFLAWQANFGCPFGCTLAQGDADGDYDVDGDDFLIWQSNFGGLSGAGASAVPEPASVGLGLLGFLGLAIGWMRRRLG